MTETDTPDGWTAFERPYRVTVALRRYARKDGVDSPERARELLEAIHAGAEAFDQVAVPLEGHDRAIVQDALHFDANRLERTGRTHSADRLREMAREV